MADFGDLSGDPDFAKLSPDAKRIVLDQVGGQDKEFQALSPEAQNLVKLRMMAPAPGVFPAEGSLFERPGEKAARFLVQPILPTLGQIGGGIAGGVITSPSIGGIPAGVLAGEAGGAALGEYLNQQLGLTKPSAAQIGLQALAPGVGRVLAAGVGAAGRFIAPRLPGTGAAFQQIGAEAGEKLPNLIRPLENVDTLYAKVSQIGAPPIATMNLSRAVEQLATEEEKIIPARQNKELLSTLNDLRQIMSGGGIVQTQFGAMPASMLGAKEGKVPFDVLRANLKRLGDRIGATEGEERGAYKMLWKAGQQDIEAAGEQFAPLKVASQAARREFSANDLREQIEKQTITPAGQGGAVQINAGKVLTWLRNSDDGKALQKAVSPDEYQAIVKELEFINRFPRLGAPLGAERGSGRRLMAGTLGAAVDLAAGGTASTGFVGGVLAQEVASGILSRALMTETGRSALRAALTRTGGTLDHAALATILSALVAETASPVEDVTRRAARGVAPQ